MATNRNKEFGSLHREFINQKLSPNQPSNLSVNCNEVTNTGQLIPFVNTLLKALGIFPPKVLDTTKLLPSSFTDNNSFQITFSPIKDGGNYTFRFNGIILWTGSIPNLSAEATDDEISKLDLSPINPDLKTANSIIAAVANSINVGLVYVFTPATPAVFDTVPTLKNWGDSHDEYVVEYIKLVWNSAVAYLGTPTAPKTKRTLTDVSGFNELMDLVNTAITKNSVIRQISLCPTISPDKTLGEMIIEIHDQTTLVAQKSFFK